MFSVLLPAPHLWERESPHLGRRTVIVKVVASPDEGSSSRGVPLNAIISEDDEELTALIRGPKRGRLDVSQILSVVAASGDEDDDVGELEEEEEMQPKYRSFAAADASSSEDEIEDEDVPDAVPVTDRPASVPLLASSTSKERSSTSPSMRSSATDLKDITSKDSKQHVGDGDHPVDGAPVPDTPGEESHTPRKPPTEPEPDSPIESFDEPQQTLQARVGSPSRPNGLLKRMKGKSASLSPQQSRLRPLMLSQKGKLGGVSEEVDPKIVSQLPSTHPPALLKPIDLDNAPKPVSPQPRRQSLDTWEILKTSSPNTDADSSLNYDELVSMNQDELTSSTPNDRRLAPQVTKRQTADSSDLHDSQPTDDPLFLPSESQRPFPYSQYQAGTDDQVDANDSDDEDEVEATVKSGPDVTASSFRRLTDIGSQRSFFSSQTPGWQKADFSRPTLQDLYGNGPEDESDSSDEDNDSGDEKTSHIPQSRRAGAK
ncbi:uncharacterized protein EV420DRAFT_187276 [Desarmillaria tabescens]|uniref:Uncharacterized protein n=1 Tax=Armillaria tabescens TaxID=1929756 RepID=A0AA39N906_ARMTA|nr:uncharacterized protein EV420DRAFT_187276 [Desarmillaria tabescens]KAK0461224.1 hypothetical protein EV420DRAFT_187276 [Desarmillaria tabescens]